MPLRVLFVTSEFDDFIRVGGLAAVSAALPRAIRHFADVRVVIPGYSDVLKQVGPVQIVGKCPPLANLPTCQIARASTPDGLPLYLVICPALFERGGSPYSDPAGRDWSDNDVRFARLASASALLARGHADPCWEADLVHVNDWQAALVPAYLAWSGSKIPSILTIHNLAYQGLFERETLSHIGAPESSFHIDGLEFYGKVSFLKAGLVYSNHLTTVSETYAREIVQPEGGCGLHGLLERRAADRELTGIINGIDDTWDPATCKALEQPFAAGDWGGKQANSDCLRRTFGLSVANGPLFGVVARLVHQKGVDLILDAADTIVAAGGQLVVMGRGEPQFEDALLEAQRKQSGAISVALRFADSDARRIFAGTDFTLMPSRFEPCGLSQMYAQRFGSLPIGHKTGGLAETIRDGETGFLFEEPSATSFLRAICRAFGTFAQSGFMNGMRGQAMSQSFSWTNSARSYDQLYRRLATA